MTLRCISCHSGDMAPVRSGAAASSASGDITGSLFPEAGSSNGTGDHSGGENGTAGGASSDDGHCITVKIEADDEDEERLIAERTSAGLMIQSREELDEYFRSLPTRGPYDCPFSGCRLLRKLHYREHLFGSSRRTATCGPLRPPDKVTRRSRPYPSRAPADSTASPELAAHIGINPVRVEEQVVTKPPPPPPQLAHHPQSHVPDKRKQSIPRKVLASAPLVTGPAACLPHVADLSPSPILLTNGTAHRVNGWSNGCITDETGIRRSTRVKKEPIDLYAESEMIVPSKRRVQKNSVTRKSVPSGCTTAVSASPASGSSNGSSSNNLVTTGTQTDLTVFHMAFIHIDDQKKKNKTTTKERS